VCTIVWQSQGGFTVDVRGKSSSSSSLALPRRGEWSDDRASALVVLAETSGAAVRVHVLMTKVGLPLLLSPSLLLPWPLFLLSSL